MVEHPAQLDFHNHRLRHFFIIPLSSLHCSVCCPVKKFVLLPLPGFTSLICPYDKYSEYCQQSARTHSFVNTGTNTLWDSVPCLSHTSACVCFYLNHVLPLNSLIFYWSESLTHTWPWVYLVMSGTKKRQVFLLQDYTRNSTVALITLPQRARGKTGPNLEHHGDLKPTAPSYNDLTSYFSPWRVK